MNRHLQRSIGLTIVGILLAGALVGGGWWLGQREDRQPVASTAPPTSPPAAGTTTPATPPGRARTGAWQRLPAAPIPGGSYAGVWTGTELLVVGGNNVDAKVFGDAAAYNPVTRSWRRLPPLPEPRTGATVTWNGREVLVVGGQGRFSDQARPYADAVAYSPATNHWRRLPAMDTGRIGHTAVCTGRQLLVWGGRTLQAGSWTAPGHGLAYDRAANRWSPLPKSPLRGRAGHIAVWTGTQMLIWGGQAARETDPQQPFTDGAVYTPYPL